MKLSTAMITGYARVGKQCKYVAWKGENGSTPKAVCALGAAGLGANGHASMWEHAWADEFTKKVGVHIAQLNDHGMCIEDIIGIAQAEGL